MKGCLEEEGLLELLLSEPGEDPIERAHLAVCDDCAAGFRKLEREAQLIVRTLEAAASASHNTVQPATRFRYHRPRFERPTLMAVAVAALAGGLTAAYALILPFHAAAPAVATLYAAAPAASASLAAAVESPYMLWEPDQRDVVITDPVDDIGYHEAVAGSSTYGDMFFCVPQDGGTFCSSSAEQG